VLDPRGTGGGGRQPTAVPPPLRVRHFGGGGGVALSDETLERLERKADARFEYFGVRSYLSRPVSIIFV
jgi:hypothetical protein